MAASKVTETHSEVFILFTPLKIVKCKAHAICTKRNETLAKSLKCAVLHSRSPLEVKIKFYN